MGVVVDMGNIFENLAFTFLRVWEGLVADLGGDSEPRLPLRDSSCSVMLAPVTSNTTITIATTISSSIITIATTITSITITIATTITIMCDSS